VLDGKQREVIFREGKKKVWQKRENAIRPVQDKDERLGLSFARPKAGERMTVSGETVTSQLENLAVSGKGQRRPSKKKQRKTVTRDGPDIDSQTKPQKTPNKIEKGSHPREGKPGG